MGKITIKICLSALVLLLLPLTASAAGLGKITVQSALGQPLRAEVEVSSVQPGEVDSLVARMAPAQAYRDAGIEVNAALISIKFATERRPDGRHVVVLTSSAPINEPFLDILIELSSSNGRLIREYTFLLDPPEYKVPQVAAPPVAPPAARIQPVEQPRQPEVRVPVPAEQKPPVSAPVQTASKAKGGAAYEVKRGDTLAKIARTTKPDGVSLQQMLIALYRGNTDAFDGDNINRLRSGRILTVPDKEAVAAVDQAEAQRLVIAQGQEFNEYRRKLGASVAQAPAQAEGKRRSSGGKITSQTEDKPLPAKDQKDQLKLSKAEAGKAGGKTAADDLIAKDKAIKEANDRVAELEKTVKELQKALELASKSMAGMQQQAQVKPAAAPAAPAAKADAVKADAAKTPVVAAEPAKAAPAAAAKADAAKAPEAAKGPEVAKAPDAAKAAAAPEAPKPTEPTEATKASDAPKAEPAKVAPKAAAKAPPPPPPPQPSFVDELLDDPTMLGGAGAVLIGLLGYGAYAYRKKRQSQFENSIMGASTPMDSSSVFGTSGGQNVDTGSSQFQTDFSQGGVGTIDTDEVDPIAEADVYIAYGRDAQAEEILKEALSKDPSRHVVTAKLLEIYASRKDLKSFESTAAGLNTATGGQGPEWGKAIALGQSIDPQNRLYGGGGTVPSAAPDESATVALAAAAPDIELDVSLDEPAPEAAVEVSAGLDFDLGAPGGEAATGTDAALDISAAQPEEAPMDLGFDLSLDADPKATASTDFTPEGTQIFVPTAGGVGDAAAAMEPALDGGLDISFDLPSPDAPAGDGTAADAGLSGASIDFDLALGEPADKPEEVAAAPLEMDLSSISLDLGVPGDTAGPTGDARWQEVATKLDLAKAYEEMGDKDGARDLLKEVMKEGDGAQQQQAKTLLAALG
ncbi:MAG: FimV/HubP family polar landmark protein [Betaproteobacteria bacterium]